MEVSVPKQIKLKDDNGAEVLVDLTRVQMNDEQAVVLDKLLARGDHRVLDESEWEKIKDIRATIRTGGESDFLVRFDWKWVRIDEAGRRFEDVISQGGG